MPIRPLTLFLILFSVLTLADIGTTWWCVQLGFDETNPFTDTTNFWTLVRPEILTVLGGAGAVCLGSWLTFGQKRWNGVESFAEFRRRLFRPKAFLGTVLFIVPLVFSVARLLPVLNNSAFIPFGDSGFSQLVQKLANTIGITYFQAYVIAHIVLFALLFYPVSFLVYKQMAEWRSSDLSYRQNN